MHAVPEENYRLSLQTGPFTRANNETMAFTLSSLHSTVVMLVLQTALALNIKVVESCTKCTLWNDGGNISFDREIVVFPTSC